MMSLQHQVAGNRLEALRWFERSRASCDQFGLSCEEYDVRQRQLRGNLPQAFVHALLLESAMALQQ
jgi:GH15 family glucan-1,4-alpha-glucosidase